ncbi:isopentenyl-diphosphate Delta-isomerase [Occultella kanbiaonis]|uniref:isopentenyl-diphosphate Delta-isomerase n=1 Tax=Occultella kanbiaonis TaxID=2675754 RepID=UPI001E61660B|nr:isopentenyl-diphosphate Delta-isomerase [Occultella kanbiaonis]
MILLDDAGHGLGAPPRATVPNRDTSLHLGFSCYLFRADGHVLLTRRALTTTTWPGVWTNSFCGRPHLDENLPDAVGRFADQELGLTIDGIDVVLPEFRFRAVGAGGMVEDEVCPVLFAYSDQIPTPNPDAVMETQWVRMEDVGNLIRVAPWALSPWMVQQLNELAATGDRVTSRPEYVR